MNICSFAAHNLVHNGFGNLAGQVFFSSSLNNGFFYHKGEYRKLSEPFLGFSFPKGLPLTSFLSFSLLSFPLLSSHFLYLFWSRRSLFFPRFHRFFKIRCRLRFHIRYLLRFNTFICCYILINIIIHINRQ